MGSETSYGYKMYGTVEDNVCANNQILTKEKHVETAITAGVTQILFIAQAKMLLEYVTLYAEAVNLDANNFFNADIKVNGTSVLDAAEDLSAANGFAVTDEFEISDINTVLNKGDVVTLVLADDTGTGATITGLLVTSKVRPALEGFEKA